LIGQARKSVNYAESDDDEDEDDVLGPIANNSRGRATKRMRVSVEEDSDDEFGLDAATQQAMLEDDDDGMFHILLCHLADIFAACK
jgi:DNA mismatch repair protein MSH6